ncbi:hypothetical protein K440DRAFT_679675 [Wilcoxina mikolae CBS 423.85]|nr:hypothetical protein K440DRAFT_679675 [Wilcoxina mikolae CBS 423.85]
MSSNAVPRVRVGITSFIIKPAANSVAAAAQGEKTTAIFTAGGNGVSGPAGIPATRRRANSDPITKGHPKPAAKKQDTAVKFVSAAGPKVSAPTILAPAPPITHHTTAVEIPTTPGMPQPVVIASNLPPPPPPNHNEHSISGPIYPLPSSSSSSSSAFSLPAPQPIATHLGRSTNRSLKRHDHIPPLRPALTPRPGTQTIGAKRRRLNDEVKDDGSILVKGVLPLPSQKKLEKPLQLPTPPKRKAGRVLPPAEQKVKRVRFAHKLEAVRVITPNNRRLRAREEYERRVGARREQLYDCCAILAACATAAFGWWAIAQEVGV